MAISKKLLNPGETIVVSTREHAKALIIPTFLMLVLLAVGTAVHYYVDVRFLVWTVWILVAIGILWWTVRPFLHWLTTAHAFTDRRLITRWGIITRRGHDIPLARVSDISIEINLLDRPFRCGSLVITNASTNGKIRLNDIPRVEQTKRQVSQLLHEVHARRTADGD